MKLKPYLKSLAKPALYLSLIFSLIFIFGCLSPLEPTYKEKEIPYHIKKICQEEYNLDVITKTSGNTLWIYAPLPRIMHKDFQVNKEVALDEEMVNKLRNILTTIGRVIVNADKVPEFYALVVSDITDIGLDYVLIGYVTDIKKSYARFIPWTETNRRYVIQLISNPGALGDTKGEHIVASDIDLRDFLAVQISQRISARFREDDLKSYFKVENSQGRFKDNTFSFQYAIKEVSEPDKKIDVKNEILSIVSYVIQTYEFKDFLMVEITDLLNQDKWVLSKASLRDF